jgi:predicted flap endonuclease-1-like 5' DNA nuclease
LPVLLVVYHRRVSLKRPVLDADIYPLTALASVLAAIAGCIFYQDAYIEVLSDNARQQSIATGIVRVGDAYIPVSVVFLALIGAWFYIMQDFIRRIRDRDLTSTAVISATFRVLLAVAATVLIYSVFQGSTGAFAFSVEESRYGLSEATKRIVSREDPEAGSVVAYYTMMTNSANSLTQYVLFALCFFSGMYPRRFMFRAHKVLASLTPEAIEVGVEGNPDLSLIQGITVEDEERLWEEGYASAQQIATASVAEIIARTKYSPATVADWIDQAKLIVYFPNRDSLRALNGKGIRTYSDLAKLKGLGDAAFDALNNEIKQSAEGANLTLFKG